MARDLREMIQILADKGDEVYSKICKVERVDEARRIIDATPIVGGATIPAVRLQPVENRKAGLIFVPKVGSFVMVTFFAVYDAYVAMGTEFEKVLLDMGDIHLELLNPEEDEKKAIITVRNGDEQTGPCIEVNENTILMRNGDRENEGCPTFRLEKERVTVQRGETSIEMQQDPSSGNDRILLKNGNNPHSPKMEMTGEKINFFEANKGIVDIGKLENELNRIIKWCNDHTHEVPVPTGVVTSKPLTNIMRNSDASKYEYDKIRYYIAKDAERKN